MDQRNDQHRNRDDEFATHYYGNERDLRERDRIAREERKMKAAANRAEGSRTGRAQPDARSRSEYDSGFDDEYNARPSDESNVRRSRDSDIGREPYRPEREYHRAYEDEGYESSGGRRKWKSLYTDFLNDFSALFRKESALIRTELGEKADLVKAGAVSITTGTIVAFVGIQAIAATIVIALGYVMPWWAAALVTGIGLLLIGWAMMAAAKKKLSGDHLTPYRSMESFEHMGHMLKEKKDEFTRH